MNNRKTFTAEFKREAVRFSVDEFKRSLIAVFLVACIANLISRRRVSRHEPGCGETTAY
jgi:hypothetical protein